MERIISFFYRRSDTDGRRPATDCPLEHTNHPTVCRVASRLQISQPSRIRYSRSRQLTIDVIETISALQIAGR